MKKEEKRIVVRVDADKWRELDDERHLVRTSFQELGLKLFGQWLDLAKKSPHLEPLSDKNRVIFSDSTVSTEQSISEEEEKWVQCLLCILRSGNNVAQRAVLSNLVAFSDYVRAVPEVPDGFADLAAKARRIAALDEQLMDAIQAAKVGGPKATSRTGRRDAKVSGRK
jgi:hypothetical protein